MTTEQLRDLDWQVARDLMGWKLWKYQRGWARTFARPPEWHETSTLEATATEERYDDWDRTVPHYSTDHNAVALVRAEIVRRCRDEVFIVELAEMFLGDVFALMTATPEQQCIAALRAVGKEVTT